MRDKESDGRIYTIVIADNEEELRKAIIRKIEWEKIGFRIVGEAENGIEALELVREKPDCLFGIFVCPLCRESSWQGRCGRYDPISRLLF